MATATLPDPTVVPPVDPNAPTTPAVPPTTNTVGLINQPPQATPPTGYNASQVTPPAPATASGYDPSQLSVSKPMTVQGQIEDITGKNSPLMQEAQARAMADANSRGLINSSLAVEAGQKAVLDTALPIAQQDAQVNYQAGVQNQNAQNAERNFAAAAGNQVAQFNAQLGVNVATTNAAAVNKSLADAFASQTQFGLANLDTATKTALANLDTQTKLALTTIDDQYKQLFQTNSNAQAEFQQVAQAIAAIAQNNTLDQAAKDQATAMQLTLLNEGLKQAAAVASTNPGDVGNLNLSQFFVPGSPGSPGLMQQPGGVGAQPGPGPAAPGTVNPTPGPGPNGAPSTQTPSATPGAPPPAANAPAAGGWPAGSDEAVAAGFGLVYNPPGPTWSATWNTPDGFAFQSAAQALASVGAPGYWRPPTA